MRASRARIQPPGVAQIQEDQLLLEENPKWSAFVKTLKEIRDEEMSAQVPETIVHSSLADGQRNIVLIVVHDQRTVVLLREYLQLGGRTMLLRRYRQNSQWKQCLPVVKKNLMLPERSSVMSATLGATNPGLSLRGRNMDAKRKQSKSSDAPMKRSNSESASCGPEHAPITTVSDKPDEVDFDASQFDDCFGLLGSLSAVIYPMSSVHRERVLYDLQPKYVLFYDADLEFVREVERYNAQFPDGLRRVYFMMYDNSVEEQRYLSSIRREKDAFERLIRTKAVSFFFLAEKNLMRLRTCRFLWFINLQARVQDR